MSLQIIATTGTSLAESSIKVDSDLALTSDQELSNEKQIVVKVSDRAKAQRDLTLTVPDGATFDVTTTEKLNQNPTYSVEFDPKDKAKQITLKEIIGDEQKTSASASTVNNSLKSVAKKDYLLVFKIEDRTILSNQQLKLATAMTSSRYESKPLVFKGIIQASQFSKEVLEQKTAAKETESRYANSRASTEYLPVPDDTVPMSGVLTQQVGTSPIYDKENDVLQITNRTGQVGGIWSKKKLNFSKDFVYDSYIYLGNQTSNAADGITFTFQNDSRMSSTPKKVIAGGGFALGVYGNSSNSRNGYVKNALSIEFDTYMNTGSRDPIDKEVNSNNGKGHIAIVIPKAKNNTASGNHINPQYPSDYLSNGKWRRFKVAWDATHKVMTYGLEGLDEQTYQFEPSKVFGANEAYWGFTGSTGNKSALNAVAISEIPQKGSQLLKIKDERTQEVITDLGQVRPGDSLTYELDTKYIDDPEDWSDIFIKLLLPTGIKYVPGTITSDGAVVGDGGNVSGQTLNVPIGDLKTDQINKLKFSAKVTNDIADGTKLLNRGLAYNTDFGVQSNLVTLQIDKPADPVLTKKVRNVSEDEKVFKDETSAYKDDTVEYEAVVSLDPGKDLSGAIFKDAIDNNLTLLKNEIQMQIEQEDGSWGDPQNVAIEPSTGEIKLAEAVKKPTKIRFVFKATINSDSKSEIDNTFSLISGSYGGPWHSNVAKVKVGKKTPPTVIKEVKNLTKADDDFALETEAEVDDQVEYRIQLVNLSSVDTKVGTVLKDVLDSDLGDIQQVKIDYLDKDENITATQTADLTDYQVTLDHVLPAAGRGMAIAYIKAKVKETDKSVINNKASLTTEFGKGTSDNAKLNIKQSKGRIVVRYRDRKDESHKLAEDETFDGKIGDTKLVQPKVIPETDGNWTVVDSSNMTNPDWGSTTKPDWTLAHDYTVTYAKDEQVITYRYEESHIGIIADKRWDFGKHDTTATDRNYYLKAKTQDAKKQPYEVGVEDYYTSKGWTLNVKQDDQFHTNANEKIGGSQKFLDNAVLNFHNGQIALKESDDIGSTAPVSKLTSEFELAPKGAAVNLMTHTNKTPDPGYYAAHGFGIWAYQFGDAQQADYSIGLKVPKATKRFPRQYTSQLTWSLVIAE